MRNYNYPVRGENILRLVALLDHQTEVRQVLHVVRGQTVAIYRDVAAKATRKIDLMMDLKTKLVYGVDQAAGLLIIADLADRPDLE